MTARRFDLEERLLDYAAAVIRLVEQLPDSRAGNHVAGQLLRSGTAPLPNHGEAEGAESRNDFVHKMGVSYKELRESWRWLRLIQRVPLLTDTHQLEPLLKETDELVRIFAASIRTARANVCREDETFYSTTPSSISDRNS
jgi:four helix bundle protein